MEFFQDILVTHVVERIPMQEIGILMSYLLNDVVFNVKQFMKLEYQYLSPSCNLTLPAVEKNAIFTALLRPLETSHVA